MIRLSALQMQTAGADPAANLARIETAAHEAARAGATLLVTPELGITSYGGVRRSVAACRTSRWSDRRQIRRDRPQTSASPSLAASPKRPGDAVYNSAIYTDGSGKPSVYRKSHLYGDYERGLFTPEKPSTCLFEHCGMTLGMLICYDVEFPENVRRLAQAGAEMILVPTATPMGASGTFIAEKMIPVRAFENQIFIAYVNNIGRDGDFDYAGRSVIAAPDGTALATAGLSEQLLTVDIESELYARSRSENTYLRDL
jgi:predicted amidohydrolase